MEIKTGKIVGVTGPKWWGQVHDFTAVNEVEKGRLVAAVSVSASQNEEIRGMIELGREVLSRLQERYFGAVGKGAFAAMKGMLTGLREEFGEGVAIAVGVFVGEYVYLGVVGEAGVWMKKKEGEGWIVKPEDRGEGEARVFSGRTTAGMSLVLGNRGFWKKIPVGTVRAAVTNFQGMEQEVESLAVMGESDGEEGKVAVIIKAGEEERRVELREEKEGWRKKMTGWWQKRPSMGYVVHGDKSEGRRKTVRLGYGFLVFLLVVAVAGNMWRKEKIRKNSAQELMIVSVEEEYQELAAISEINPESVKVRLADLKLRLEPLTGSKDPRIAEIQLGIGKLENITLGVREASFEEVVDLGLVREGIVGGRMAKTSGQIAVVDSEGKRLLMVDLKKKTAEVVAGEQDVRGASLIAGYPGKITGWGKEGVVECTTAEVKCALVVKTDPEWKDIKGIGVWGGNIYLLDAGLGQIYRYQRLANSYGKKENWVAVGQEQGLAGAGSMAIDGRIWVTAGQKILRFNQGNAEIFEVSGWDKPMGEEAILFTSGEQNYLYILDKMYGRVIILSKTGQYEKQLRSKIFAEAADMVVDETGGKIYILTGSKVIKTDLL